MKLSNKWYDRMKWVVQIVLPAIGSLYAGLAVLWDFPNGNEVVGSLAITALFLGSVLGISSASYKSNQDDPGAPPAGVPPEG